MRYTRWINSISGLVVTALTFAMIGIGCGEPTEEEETNQDHDTNYDELEPFDEANISGQLARLESATEIDDLRGEATTENSEDIFGQIQDEYESNSLNEKVAGRTDDHIETHGWGVEDLGNFWDQQIYAAIDRGSAGESEADIAWAGQVVDKGLMVFFYYSVYHELFLKKRKNFDEAHGYYGLNFEGEPREHAVLASNAASREDEFGLTINQPIFESFIDARHALAHGTETNEDTLGEDETYDAAMQTVDEHMLQILAFYAAHEMKELTEDNADIKLIEARVIWEGVAAYAEEVDSETATAIMDGLYPEGVPDRDSDDYFYAGLEDVRSGDTEIDAQSVYDDMVAIGETLRE